MNDQVLKLESISRSFVQGRQELQVLKGIDFTINQGEIVALVGASGSGKSTLLQICGLLDNPTGGKIILEGIDASKASDKIRTRLRLKYLGFVYQFHHLLPEFTAGENIAIPQMIAGIAYGDAIKKAENLLELLGLANRKNHRPAELSGGEQQRVAIARAIANNPKLLLADEPTGNLDPKTAEAVFSIFLELAKSQGLAAIVATHNLDLAKRMGRIIDLQNGRI